MANRNFLYINADFDTQEEVTSITTSAGAGDAAKLITLDGAGKIDISMIPDAIINQRDYKDSVRVAVETNVTLSAPGAALDGVTMANGERFLAAGQTSGDENGIYVFNGAAVAATRAPDADSSAEVTAGMTTVITEGTRADSFAILTTNDPIVLDTTVLTFAFLSGSSLIGGAGIDISGGTVSVDLVADGGLETTPAGVAGLLQVKFADTSDSDDLDGTNGLHAVSAQDLSSNGANQGAKVLGADPTSISQSSQTTIQGVLEDMSGVLDTASGSTVFTSAEALATGDLVYISGNNLVSKQPVTGAAKSNWPIGVVKAGVATANDVEILANDKVITGVISGLSPTAGDKVFWTGSALSLAAPGAGNKVIQVGIAKNATDLYIDVNPIKVNA